MRASSGGAFQLVVRETILPERRALVSVNIDVANLPREAIEKLVEIAPRQGRVVLQQAFGDWRREDMDEMAIQLHQYGFHLVHCPAWPNQQGRLKSVVDDVMAQHMRDQLEFAPEVEVFIVGSGDRNFIAVVNALKRHRKRVVVAADQESINRELRLCADEYLALPRGRGTRWARQVAAEAEFELPTGQELLERVRQLSETTDYLTLRRIIRSVLPDEAASTERVRTALTGYLQGLIDGGQLKVERRTIRGRSVNTIVPVDGTFVPASQSGSPTEEAAPEVAPPPAPRRRSHRRSSVSTSA